MDGIWECIESKWHGAFKIFEVSEHVCISPRNKLPHSFFVLEAGDWVNVVAVTPDQELVCIHQWRPGTREVELEIPGGIVDPGETPEEAARRELLEESGYTADSLTHLGTMAPNPAILNNQCHFFAAIDARPTHAQQLDPGEAISVSLVELSRVPELIKDGVIRHGIIIAALCYFMLHQQTA